MISFFYELDAGRTLIVNYFAVGIKEKDLINGTGMLVKPILLGESSMFHEDHGIGAGLAKYVEQLFQAMYEGLE